LISSGANTGILYPEAISATESNHIRSEGESLWVNTAAISNPCLDKASIPAQPKL
jgi:hypothetical protein